MANDRDSLENRLRDALQRSTAQLHNYEDWYKQSQTEKENLMKTASL